MSLFATLAKHTRNYSLASVLTTVAGLVSFPVLTRVLQVEDYGLMNLIASALALAVGLGKLGMQHAAMRFYSDVKSDRVPGATLPQFMPTVVYGMALLGLLAMVLWVGVALAVPDRLWADSRMSALMLLTAVLVLARVLLSGVQNVLRAQEHSGVLSVMLVVHRYASLALVLGAVLLISPTLWSFYGATVLSELALLAFTMWWVVHTSGPIALRQFSPDLLKGMVAFAIPMTGYELASVVLQLGDRYVQQAYLNTEAVGLYSAAYNLCDYVRLTVFTSMTAAVMPMALRLSSERGREATEDFLDRFTHSYLGLCLLVVAMLCAVRVELLSILASSKYQAGADVVPWLILGMVCEAYFGLAGIGLYLQKRSKATMGIIAAGAALNMLLNVALVPTFGIRGSAISNLVSCLAIVLVAQWATGRTMRSPGYLGPALKFGLMAAAAYWVAEQVRLDNNWATLVLRSVLVLGVYAALALATDQRMREALQMVRGRLGMGQS